MTSDARAPGLSAYETAVVARLVDIIIPADEAPGGWSGGVERLLAEHLGDFMAWCADPLRRAVAQVEAGARETAGVGFVDLTPDEQEAVFAELEAAERAAQAGSEHQSGWPFDRASLTPFAALIVVSFEGYYGGTREPTGWSVAGFRPVPKDVVPVDPDPVAGTPLRDIQPSYDVIVVGAGAGGGVAAAELSEAGRHVLLLERAPPHRNSDLRGNHLQGKRLAEYEVTAGPGVGHPRVLEHADGSTSLLPGERSGNDYGLVAMTLGGGTRVWQGMSWRFYPEDFQMAEVYGRPDGSTLADWPFDYDELEPYYDRVEWELGVCGDGNGVLGDRTPRSRPYPMPPLPGDPTRVHLGAAARKLGWRTTAIPFAINSVPRAGRAACVRCAQCAGHACPVDAKNGTQNAFIPRAIASGHADLLTRSQVLAIEHDGRGHATGVRVVTETAHGPIESRIAAKRIVVAAGALETPRLLLASGLGNDWVGRNHHSHGVSLAIATQASDVKTYSGPGHSIATLEFVHRDRAAWGGGVLFDMPPSYPLALAHSVAGLGGPGHGAGHKAWMRRGVLPLGVVSMVQEIPDESARISLDPVARDRYGMPALRAAGTPHAATLEAAAYMADRAREWIEQSEGGEVRAIPSPGLPQGTEHSAGTVRLGSNSALAACDPRGRLFGTENVYVADASLHPTNGGFNPGLTVMANALRVARLMVAE